MFRINVVQFRNCFFILFFIFFYFFIFLGSSLNIFVTPGCLFTVARIYTQPNVMTNRQGLRYLSESNSTGSWSIGTHRMIISSAPKYTAKNCAKRTVLNRTRGKIQRHPNTLNKTSELMRCTRTIVSQVGGVVGWTCVQLDENVFCCTILFLKAAGHFST